MCTYDTMHEKILSQLAPINFGVERRHGEGASLVVQAFTSEVRAGTGLVTLLLHHRFFRTHTHGWGLLHSHGGDRVVLSWGVGNMSMGIVGTSWNQA